MEQNKILVYGHEKTASNVVTVFHFKVGVNTFH